MYSSVSMIPLPNLRVIRAEHGGYKIHPNLSPASLIIRRNSKHQLSLQSIDLHNLKSIVRGSVYIYDNPGLCNWSDHVNWSELFENPGEQQVLGKEAVEAQTKMDGVRLIDPEVTKKDYCHTFDNGNVCADTCPTFSNGQRYCWGPTREECQSESRCGRLKCNRCYNSSAGQFCCHDQCLGGCYGPNPDQCVACKALNDSGVCVPNCWWLGDSYKYRLGTTCVPECPVGFFTENDACVTHCTSPLMYAVGRLCKPCGEQCPKTCEIAHLASSNGDKMQLFGREQLKNLTNCTHLKGDLIIDERSFHSSKSTPSHVPLRTVDDLWALHSLREISGYVYLDLGYFGDRLENLTFLENLRKVSGFHSAIKCSVMIMNSGAHYPGLRNLRYAPHGSVIFMNNSRLCFIQSLPWLVNGPGHDSSIYLAIQARVTGDLRIRSEGNADPRYCAGIQAICHSNCDSNYGCWGPGPEHCVRCLKSRSGDQCVSTCDDNPGYMPQPVAITDKGGMTQITEWVPNADRQCLPCHPECRTTCSGPGADECIGGCKTAWAHGRCVSRCEKHTFFDADLRICEPCHSDCHQRRLTGYPICSGPHAHFGPGGCNKCEKLLITTGIKEEIMKNLSSTIWSTVRNISSSPPLWICIQGACPPKTYETTEFITSNSEFARVAEAYTSLLPVCRACHPLCRKCTAYSLLESNSSDLGCVECSGRWFRGLCVSECPEKNTYAIPRNKSKTLSGRDTAQNSAVSIPNSVRQIDGRCLACHSECHMGCWGPVASQCFHCQHVRVHLNIVPSGVLKNFTELQEAWEAANKQMITDSILTAHSIPGPALCLPRCPLGLSFVVVDPFTGDRLCHATSTISRTEKRQIVRENSRYTHIIHPRFQADHGLTGKTYISRVMLVFFILFTIILMVVLCCCYHRLRRAQKSADSVIRTIPLIGSCLGAWGSASKALFSKNSPTIKFNSGDDVELKLLSDVRDGLQQNQAGGCTDSRDGSLTWRSPKAPNLGRLVMIQSDDLILDERSGPLGTGAFGAVYRGLWRVPSSDNSSFYSTNSLLPNEISTVASQSLTTMSTALPSLEYEEAAESEHGANQEETMKPRSQNNEQRSIPGNTVKGQSKHKLIQVAVKILNELRGASDLDALLDEAKVMASVSHRNCLPLLGVCLSQSRKCLVSAYVVNGSLERYLRSHGSSLSASLLISWCKQIADGMRYLQSLGIIHRDLATRNVLVTSREQLQITDFGLAKMLEGEDEENGGELVVRSGRVPIRWLAIETLTQGKYSFKTDVWAYGVTIWEVFTFGKKPYEGIETSNVKSHVLSGNRLPQPETCTTELYRIMLACWLENPKKRPDFATLLAMFQKLSLIPEAYVCSKASASITVTGTSNDFIDDFNSQVLSYCGFNDSSTSRLTPSTQKTSLGAASGSRLSNIEVAVAEQTVRNGSGSLLLNRRSDARRRARCSLIVSPTHHLQPGKFAKYQQQKRRSTGCRPETATLSTSLSMTSSGLSDRWSNSAFPHHSHPVLSEVQESTTADVQGDHDSAIHEHALHDGKNSMFHSESLKTDSWASSGQPLLSNDQDSSVSQLILSNLAYTSSSSHASVPNQVERIIERASSDDIQHPCNNDSNGRVISNTINGLPNTMPSNFELEAAAGYVWPQWPAVNLNSLPSDSIEMTQLSSGGDEELSHLTRQLWLRRNARQRQFYQRQSQMQRSNLGAALMEEGSEEALTENENPWNNNRVRNHALGGQGDSDADTSSERYAPDPTLQSS